MTAPLPPAAPDAGRAAPRPASTGVAFGLLVALSVLPGVWVGDALWLHLHQKEPVVPLAWLLVPALLIGAGIVALTLPEPASTIRRQGLEPVPPGLPAAIRFAALVQHAGVSPTPLLVQRRGDRAVTARAFGRPGRYAVKVPQPLQGMLRRRSEVFDQQLRHELAHIRTGDVVLATIAYRGLWVALAAIAVPVLVWTVERDASLLPATLLQAAGQAAAVVVVRAHLLRSREFYADVRATPEQGDVAGFTASLALAAAAPSGRRPAWLALHPSPARRAAVVAEPRLLARPSVFIAGAAGFAVGSLQPLVHLLLAASDPAALAWSRQVAHLVSYGLLGLVFGCEIVKAARYGHPGTAPLRVPAAAAFAGLLLGVVCSVGMVDIEVADELRSTALTGALVLLVLLALAGAAGEWFGRRQRSDPAAVAWTAGTSLLAGLFAAWLEPLSEVGSTLGWQGWLADEGSAEFLLAATNAAALTPWLAGGVASTALLLAGRGLLPALGHGLLGALACGAALVALLLASGGVVGDVMAQTMVSAGIVLVLATSAGTAMATAAGHPPAVAVAAAGIATAGGGLLFVGAMASAGFTLAPEYLASSLAPGLLVALPLAGLGAACRDPRPPAWSQDARRAALVTAAGLGLTALTAFTLLPLLTSGDQLRPYLTQDVPALVDLREDAYRAAAAAVASDDPLQQLLTNALPRYELALETAGEVAVNRQVEEDTVATDVHQAYVAMIWAEVTAWQASAISRESPSEENQTAAEQAGATATQKVAAFEQRFEQARDKARVG